MGVRGSCPLYKQYIHSWCWRGFSSSKQGLSADFSCMQRHKKAPKMTPLGRQSCHNLPRAVLLGSILLGASHRCESGDPRGRPRPSPAFQSAQVSFVTGKMLLRLETNGL